jgi:hypothetical protein
MKGCEYGPQFYKTFYGCNKYCCMVSYCICHFHPGANVKLFLSVIYGFLYKAYRVFVRIDQKSLPITNTLAYYENL